MLCVSTAKGAGRGAERGVDNVAVIQSDKWGAPEAFAKPWSGGTRPIRIEAKRHGSHTSVGGLRAGPGVDRVAATIQSGASSSRVAIPLLVDTPGVVRGEARDGGRFPSTRSRAS